MSIAESYRLRRKKLAALLPNKRVLFHNGLLQHRTIPTAGYPFRGNSHFLYFIGRFPAGALAVFENGEVEVFLPPITREHALWEGAGESWEKLGADFGVEKISPRRLAPAKIGKGCLAVPILQVDAVAEIQTLIGRAPALQGEDRDLALALIEVRLIQDTFATSEIRKAAEVTAAAYAAGWKILSAGVSGADVLAEMEAVSRRANCREAFPPIVTTEAEVLHSTKLAGTLAAGEMLLVDFGVETEFGFCSDVTRTWPVDGKLSAAQRDIYQLVLETQRSTIAEVKAGILYGGLHLHACRSMTQGLKDLGVFTGEVDSLVERGAHTLFFPHGVGHLLGMDAHDLEDFGDLAGYADGQTRDPRFGFNFLRLDRRLREGMLVTIEPGWYWIPALLEDQAFLAPFKDCIQMDRINALSSVRGVRIEDDVLLLSSGAEVITAAIPKAAE